MTYTYHDTTKYSTSHIGSVTIGCFFERKVNVVMPMKNTYLHMFFWSSTSSHQSLCEYPTSQ